MTTFDSTKRSLPSLLQDITSGKIQLPDFQRGWVWDDDHVRDLLVSIARSFPVGAVMLLETGGAVRFQVRPVEGVKSDGLDAPESLILDGQQRLTTLTQAIAITSPVHTRTNKGKPIKRHYYFDIQAALDAPERLEEAIVAVDESRRSWRPGSFGRELELDLSTRELECRQMHFPCDQVLSWSEWLQDLNRICADEPGFLQKFLRFQADIINKFNTYQIPIIELRKNTPKEAVCLVFEKVNTGGVSLTVFELMTATYAADNYNLRDDWYGSEIRSVDSRQQRLAADPLLTGVEATQFLQAITLLQTWEERQADIKAGKEGRQRRPVSAKRADVLELELGDYKRWAGEYKTGPVEQGFLEAGKFLRGQAFYAQRELPYATQIVPLAAVLAELGDRWREHRINDKLARWFWCGALGELYGGAVETRIANDVEELLQWVNDDAAVPRTVTQASFQPERLYELRTRNSAAYKAINTLVLRQGACDFFWKLNVKDADKEGVTLDIHHIFPKKWCNDQDPRIAPADYDHIINKTPISARTNRMIGGAAPSEYLERIQKHENVKLDDAGMDAILAKHCIPGDRLRADDFYGFIREREARLVALIEKAMGKRVTTDATEAAAP